MKNSSQLLKFTELCMRLATRHVPLYSSKKHLFTQTQLITLYGLKIVVAAVPGAGGGVPGIQPGAGSEAGSELA